MFDPVEYEALVRSVVRVFPEARVESDSEGYFVVWPLQGNPVIAKGSTPQKAWRKAARLVNTYKKKDLEKLKAKIKKTVELQEGPFV